MNIVRYNIQHPDGAVGSATTRLLHQERHRETFVQNAQLSIGRFGVAWVGEDAAVQNGAMDIGHHAAHVPGRVRLPTRWIFDGVKVFGAGFVPKRRVSFIHRVDLAAFGDLYLVIGSWRMGAGGNEPLDASK